MNRAAVTIILIINASLSSLSQVLLKKSALTKHIGIIGQYLNFYVVCAYLIYFMVLGINIFMMRYVDMSFVAIFSETLPVAFSTFTGYIFFKEKFTITKLCSIILIIAGIIMITI